MITYCIIRQSCSHHNQFDESAMSDESSPLSAQIKAAFVPAPACPASPLRLHKLAHCRTSSLWACRAWHRCRSWQVPDALRGFILHLLHSAEPQICCARSLNECANDVCARLISCYLQAVSSCLTMALEPFGVYWPQMTLSPCMCYEVIQYPKLTGYHLWHYKMTSC